MSEEEFGDRSTIKSKIEKVEQEVVIFAENVTDALQLGKDLIAEIQAEEDYPPDYLKNVIEKVSLMKENLSEIREKFDAAKEKQNYLHWKSRCQSQIKSLNNILSDCDTWLATLNSNAENFDELMVDYQARKSTFKSHDGTIQEIKRLANFASIHPASDQVSAKAIKAEISNVCQKWTQISKQLDSFDAKFKARSKALKTKKEPVFLEDIAIMESRASSLPPESRAELDQLMVNAKQFEADIKAVEDWLKTVKDKLSAAKSDQETPDSHLVVINDLLTAFEAKKMSVDQLNDDGSNLAKRTRERSTFSSQFKSRLSNLNITFEEALESTHLCHQDIEKVILDRRKLFDNIQELHAFVQSFPSDVFTDIDRPVSQPSELSQKTFKLLKLKDSVESKRQLYDEVTSAKNIGEKLKSELTELEVKWNDVCEAIVAKYGVMKNASDDYGEFKTLAAQEADWLERLEKKLTKSANTAADAEEISEELDDIENFLNNHQGERHVRLKELSKSLMAKNIFSSAIVSEAAKLEERWETLARQAMERTTVLEGTLFVRRFERKHIITGLLLF